jgi:hypothetical protein
MSMKQKVIGKMLLETSVIFEKYTDSFKPINSVLEIVKDKWENIFLNVAPNPAIKQDTPTSNAPQTYTRQLVVSFVTVILFTSGCVISTFREEQDISAAKYRDLCNISSTLMLFTAVALTNYEVATYLKHYYQTNAMGIFAWLLAGYVLVADLFVLIVVFYITGNVISEGHIASTVIFAVLFYNILFLPLYSLFQQ